MRVWLVTGAGSGLGAGLTRAVLDHGDRVVATARDVAKLKAADLDGALYARLDVTDADSIEDAVGTAMQAYGRIDVLVNNAGAGLLGAFEELSDEQLRRNFEVNFFGQLAVTRAVLPIMRTQAAGHVVQLSSVIGVVSGLGGTAYAGTKAALEAHSEALAAELRPFGIRVLIVEPGPFRTDFGGAALEWGTPMPEYADVVGPARAAFEASHGRQPGDPYRAGQAVIAAVESTDPPLRLPLGPGAYQWIRAYLDGRVAELDKAAPLGADVNFR